MERIGKAACERIVSASTRSSTAQFASTLTCSEVRMDGIFLRVLMSSEAETVRLRSVGTAVEKTKQVPRCAGDPRRSTRADEETAR
jgi:hypothetical protein